MLQLDDTLGTAEPGEYPDNQHGEGYALGIQCKFQ